ncbi:MAG: bifunctional hydroxymethylpyrimidine kinase/phosphomethylpyrimidine kinase [Paludibacteraceae bacterium]|nr:bifunctional hydroxymethylpyrimidine kinase/phosphomethylpyrimidine kinase [Paludibacteraceae bacterium]
MENKLKSNGMKDLIPILSVTGSDGTGGSGIQADIKTCAVLGGYALSVVTAVTVQDTRGILSTHPMPSEVIDSQLESITRDMPPCAVKVGMLCDVESVEVVSKHVRKLRNVVLDTAFVSSRGESIASRDVVDSVRRKVMPYCEIVIMKLSEVELLLNGKIANCEDLLSSAQLLLERGGLKALVVQGALNKDGVYSDLFFASDDSQPQGYFYQYFVLPDFTNCNTHGLAGTLSACIANYLAQKNPLPEAVKQSYRYLQTLTVYSVSSPLGHQSSLIGHTPTNSSKLPTKHFTPRQQEIYNAFMQLLTNHYDKQHDVQFYADRLNISIRYLSQVTMSICGKPSKQLVMEALIDNASKLLTTTTYSIQEIAFRLGFSSQAQFTRVFKQMKGVAPSDFRGVKN